MIDWKAAAARAAMTIWLVAGSGCGKDAKKQASDSTGAQVPAAGSAAMPGDNAQPVAASPTQEVSMLVSAPWGDYELEVDESGPALNVNKVSFEAAPTAVTEIRLPKAMKLSLAKLPAKNEATPLSAEQYEFNFEKGAGGKADGFRFVTKKDLDREMISISVLPKAKGSHEVSVSVGAEQVTATVEPERDCVIKINANQLQQLIARVKGGPEALAALSKELEERVTEMAQPARMMRIAVVVLGRSLINADRLRRAVSEEPCGVPEIAFECKHEGCEVKLPSGPVKMKKQDWVTIEPGSMVEVVSLGSAP